MADWMNATGTVQVAIIEAVQYYIDEKQSMDVDRIKALQGFKLTDKVNAIVMAHIASQQAAQPQPVTEPAVIPTDLSHVGAELNAKYEAENAADPPSTST